VHVLDVFVIAAVDESVRRRIDPLYRCRQKTVACGEHTFRFFKNPPVPGDIGLKILVDQKVFLSRHGLQPQARLLEGDLSSGDSRVDEETVREVTIDGFSAAEIFQRLQNV
jgi:hypothetical protein